MRVVITGGAGFIGANLVGHLLDEEFVDEVAVVDDLSTGFRSNLDPFPEAKLHEGSILDVQLLDEVFDGADAVVHLAARPSVPRSIADPEATHEVNATGTLRVLEAARRAGGLHTILASSSSVYGANPTLPKHEDLRPEPVSPYAVSKLAAETYAVAFHHCYGLPVLPFRFFNVFGPLQAAGHAYAAVIPAFLDAALSGLPIPVNGDGQQTRDFTYVGSVTNVIAHALDHGTATAQPVNLAFGSRRSLNDVIGDLNGVFERELLVDHRPDRAGDVRHSQADGGRLRHLFPGVEPVDFQTGLQRTVAWFRALGR
jgi:UDP-glucose 4-epimerase